VIQLITGKYVKLKTDNFIESDRNLFSFLALKVTSFDGFGHFNNKVCAICETVYVAGSRM